MAYNHAIEPVHPSPSDCRSAVSSPYSTFSVSNMQPGCLEGVRLLVVEDSADNQALLKRMLQRAGAQVAIEGNGEDGMHRALREPFDIVVMDIQMPVMDGIEATQNLRANGFDHPIVALTAHGQRGDRERSLEMGFDEFLNKPVQTSVLVESIARLVKRRQHMPRA